MVLQTLLHATNYRTPLLRTLIPTVALAYGIQTAAALPSIAAQSERFYDLSGSLTYLSCTAVSLALPYLRARSVGSVGGLGEYLSAPAPGQTGWWWRHVVLSVAVGGWAVRLGTFLFQRITTDNGTDSRFDKIRSSPAKFYIAFFAQATWVSLCTLPVVLINSLPRSAFAIARLAHVTPSKIPQPLSATPYWTDIFGLAIFLFGLVFEVTADRQKSAWLKEKKEKKHEEDFLTRGLWARSRHPNYFGEITLWCGIAVAAGGVLVRAPALGGLGLGSVWGAKVVVAGLCAASPGFVTFLLTRVSGIPLSEGKYDGKFGDREDYRRWKRETPVLVPRVL
ncbi:DUF1295-domain-containing protein [Massarina eburnea CBS 473.64]|uniref:DUF1295-domain-containing protein n=1 Tax=Massarina eburnea CBS 473.64 TaxID=1395130 RepID=A0A6A6RN02_9PLEO|nr:DUF1295-domain-containing protein [Massarina eburnea CBS 473.64]